MFEPDQSDIATEPGNDTSVAQMMGLSPAEFASLCSRELRRAAFHEASHAALVHRFGGHALPVVWRNPSPDVMHSAWLGRCHILAQPGSTSFRRGEKKQFGIARLPKLWPVYCGLAGFAGERMAFGETEAWEVLEAFWDARSSDQISASDLAMIERDGHRVTERTVATTMRYLRRFWSDVERTAMELEDAAPYESGPRL